MVRFAGPAALKVLRSATDDACAQIMGEQTDAGEATAAPIIAPFARSHRLQVAGLALPALVIVYPQSRSAIGQDTVELLLPGSPVLLEMVLQALLERAREILGNDSALARRAEPGEFLARAWLSGRITLTEAEGIAASIAAQSSAQLSAASGLRDGRLGRLAAQVADELSALLALVEAGIDFIDEADVSPASPERVYASVRAIEERIEGVLQSGGAVPMMEGVPRVVLRGAPNAGKSQLFNALVGRDRMIVSAMAGSTRDAIEESILLPPMIVLVDTAGVDAQAEGVGSLAQDRGANAEKTADVVLRCVDATDATDATDECAGARACASDAAHAQLGATELVVLTKCDLLPRCVSASGRPCAATAPLRTSALTGAGLNELKQAITSLLRYRDSSVGGAAVSLSPRHADALRQAVTSLRGALELADSDSGRPHLSMPELVAAHLRAALDQVGLIAGRADPDAILGLVFSRFCIGK